MAVRLADRARIVLLAAQSVPNKDVARRMRITPNKAGRWRRRFAEEGVPGIEKDRPRGAPPRHAEGGRISPAAGLPVPEERRG